MAWWNKKKDEPEAPQQWEVGELRPMMGVLAAGPVTGTPRGQELARGVVSSDAYSDGEHYHTSLALLQPEDKSLTYLCFGIVRHKFQDGSEVVDGEEQFIAVHLGMFMEQIFSTMIDAQEAGEPMFLPLAPDSDKEEAAGE